MSTHVLDLSGQRALNLTINDPARTGASCSAKAGDDVGLMVGGAKEVRISLPPNVKIQRREYVTKTVMRDEKNNIMKDEDGETRYEEKPYESLVLVMAGSLTAFARCSHIDPDEKQYEGTPHTSLVAKKWGTDLHFTESGKLLSEQDLSELLGSEPVEQ